LFGALIERGNSRYLKQKQANEQGEKESIFNFPKYNKARECRYFVGAKTD
jgi:hypothetical protein